MGLLCLLRVDQDAGQSGKKNVSLIAFNGVVFFTSTLNIITRLPLPPAQPRACVTTTAQELGSGNGAKAFNPSSGSVLV